MKIRFTPGALVFLGAQFFTGGAFLASLLAALLHECGHLLAARLSGIRLRLLEVDVLGARLYPQGSLPSYGAEAVLAASGPAASLLLAIPLIGSSTPFAASLRLATLSFALFNLLPIEGFDGGRMVSGTLLLFLAPRLADKVSELLSFFFLFVLWCVSVYLMMRVGNELSLFFFSTAIFFRIFLQKKPL